MREEDGIGAAPTALALPRRGLVVLKNVIQLLREEARFVDEEGDDTNALDELLEALCADGVNGIRYTSWCDEHRRATPCDKCASGVAGIPVPAGRLAAWMHVQGNYSEPSLRPLDDDEKARGWTQFPLYAPGVAGNLKENDRG